MSDKVTNKEKLESLIEFAEINYGIKDVILHASDWSSATFNVKFGTLTLWANENFIFNYPTDKFIIITTGQLGSFCNTKHFRRWQSNFEEVVQKVVDTTEEVQD